MTSLNVGVRAVIIVASPQRALRLTKKAESPAFVSILRDLRGEWIQGTPGTQRRRSRLRNADSYERVCETGSEQRASEKLQTLLSSYRGTVLSEPGCELRFLLRFQIDTVVDALD